MTTAASLRTLVLAAILAPAGVVVVLISTLSVQTASRSLERALERRLQGTARSVGLLVTPEQILFLQPGDETTRTYRRSVKALSALARRTEIERIQVIRPEPFAIVIDSKAESLIGAKYLRAELDGKALTAVLGLSTSSSKLYTLQGEVFKTAYAPIEQDGHLVAIAAVSASARYQTMLRMMQRNMVAAGLVAGIGLTGLAMILAQRLSSPLRALSDLSDSIAAGVKVDFPTKRGPREAQQLHEHMELMEREIRKRQEELTMMMAGIAHEVRNPLGGMQLFAGLLAEDLSGDDRLSHVRRIEAEIENLNRVVDDFLSFSKTNPLHLEKVDPVELLREVETSILSSAEKKAVGVEVHSEVEKKVMMDRARVRRALLNLGLNAVDAVKAGGRVRFSAQTFRSTHLVFAVEDNGPGLDEATLEKAFQPFFTTKQKGTGLGLPLVQAVARQHEGSVMVSRHDDWTRIAIQFPMKL